MLNAKRAVGGMLVSFVAGGLLVGGLVLGWRPPRDMPSLVAAARADPAQPAPAASWLQGNADEKLAQVEKHLRGLDVSMVEIGHRYAELLSAGETRNFEYAKYQTEKIDYSLRLAIERRPKRAKSALPFLEECLGDVMRAVERKDGPTLDVALDKLRVGCIQCHRSENVLYMGDLFAKIHPSAPAAAQAVQEYKKKLTPDYLQSADRSAGRLVYAEYCANCHRLFGEGIDNGPDLTGLQRSNLDYLLTTTIDPNAVIGNDYQAAVVVTTEGRIITGLVKREDPENVTIQTATETVVIPIDEIEERAESPVSFMPEGILQKLSDDEVRDLIGYLQGPEQAPLPPEQPNNHFQEPEPKTMLIEPVDLQEHLREPPRRILDTRAPTDYAQGHIPGAVLVDVKSWQNLGKKDGGFHDAKAWGEMVGRLGISHDSEVTVYGSNLPDTARIWWTLKYLGLEKVTVLNGGWQMWVKENLPTDTASPSIDAVSFEPRFQADRLEEIDSLKESLQSDEVNVVDARSTDEFIGKEVRGKRGGHIPGATHLEWKVLLAEDGRFKSRDELRDIFRDRGIAPDQTAVTC